jgi:hypothetical protein
MALRLDGYSYSLRHTSHLLGKRSLVWVAFRHLDLLITTHFAAPCRSHLRTFASSTSMVSMQHGRTALRLAIQRRASLRQFSVEIGAAHSLVSQWLSGKRRPGPYWRLRLAELIGIPFDAWEDEPRKAA